MSQHKHHHASNARTTAKVVRTHRHHGNAVMKDGKFDVQEGAQGFAYWFGKLRSNENHLKLFEQKTPLPGIHILLLIRAPGPAPADSPFNLDQIEESAKYWIAAEASGEVEAVFGSEDAIDHSHDDLLMLVRKDK